MKDERDRQHPVYKVNTDSKRYLALTFLACAVLDDRNGTDFVDDMIVDYYDSELKEKYETLEYVCTNPSYPELSEQMLSWIETIKHDSTLGEAGPIEFEESIDSFPVRSQFANIIDVIPTSRQPLKTAA